MASAYSRGADFERRAKARLETMGYVVFRTAGSRSPVDLVAFLSKAHYLRHLHHSMWDQENPLMFIQCKSGSTKISSRERMELVDLAADCGAIPVLCTRGLKFEVLSGEAKAA
jgi:Holliday junction resolvase